MHHASIDHFPTPLFVHGSIAYETLSVEFMNFCAVMDLVVSSSILSLSYAIIVSKLIYNNYCF